MVRKKTKNNKNSGNNSDSDDDTFYYRYSSAPPHPPPPSATQSSHPKNPTTTSINGGSSSTLAPSKSTIYISNLDYSLTNSDLHTLFSTFGKIARVTVLKNRETRLSRGVAFIQFVNRNDAVSAARQMHGKVLNGRTLTASIAADNGRAPEFIRKRVYRDKTRCYECGDEGHLSYECPKNQLGPRERPVPKRGRKGGWNGGRGDGGGGKEEDDGEGEGLDGGGEGFEDDNWASVVDGGANERLLKWSESDGVMEERKKMKKASYFSDESDGEDE